MNRSHLALLALPLLAACGGLDDSRFPTGSSTLAASGDYATLLTIDPDSGVVGTMDADGVALERLDLGGEPTRIARLGDRFLVSQRGDRTVAVLSGLGSGLRVDERVPVGAEPVGVVASEDGAFAYVAASRSGTVVEIDGDSLALTRSWRIPGEPRWLALHPSGAALFVASAIGESIHRVDLASDEVSEIALPTLRAQAFADGAEFSLTARVTGDLAISPDGGTLAVPLLYVDNTTPVPPAGSASDEVGIGGGYAANGGGRFVGTVVTLTLDGSGVVSDDDPTVLTLNGSLNSEDFATVGGYAASVSWDTSGDNLFATMEGAGAVLHVQAAQRQRFNGGGGMAGDAIEPMPPEVFEDGSGGTGASLLFGQVEAHATDTIATGPGPRGVISLDADRVFVQTFLDRSVAALPMASIPRRNEFGETPQETGGPFRGEATTIAFGGMSAGAATELAPDVLPADVRQGRELFYSSTDSRMSSNAAPISCATCHADGRADGITWTFQNDAGDLVHLQTPSLAGDISRTAPVTWLDSVPTVADEAMLTSQGRMGGAGLRSAEADVVAAYIDWSRAPEPLGADLDREAVRRGQALFRSKGTRCSSCHRGDALTDNQGYDLYGVQGVRTRSLLGIGASAPYLHDGSAQTLRGLVERSRDGSMGDTSSLSDAQVDDLVTYLRSL